MTKPPPVQPSSRMRASLVFLWAGPHRKNNFIHKYVNSNLKNLIIRCSIQSFGSSVSQEPVPVRRLLTEEDSEKTSTDDEAALTHDRERK